MTLVARNINMDLYREFKAEAIRRGLKVSEALEEAMRLWLSKNRMTLDPVVKINNEVYERMKDELKAKYYGKYVVIAKGRFIGAYDSLRDVSRVINGLNVKHAIVVRIGMDEAGRGEWWGGSIEV